MKARFKWLRLSQPPIRKARRYGPHAVMARGVWKRHQQRKNARGR